jgi:hypothetical protein
MRNLQYDYQYFPYRNYCLLHSGKTREKTPDGNKRANSFQIKSHTKGKKQKKTDKPWRVSLLVLIGLP